jgi:membrane protein
MSILSDLKQRSEEGVQSLDSRSRGWLSVLGASFLDVLSFQNSLHAAAIAYFTLFSVFPLAVLTVAIATFWLDAPMTGGDIIARLEFAVPGLNRLLGDTLERIISNRASLTRIAAITLLWSASSVFYVLTRALDAIWETETQRPAWRHRALALLVTLSVSLVLLSISLISSVIIGIINRLLPDLLAQGAPVLVELVVALINILLFALLYTYLPHARLRLIDMFPGAIVGGLLWDLAKRLFLLYVTGYLPATNLLYGSVTTIVAVLIWVYASSLIFLYGGYVNAHYRRLQQRRRELEAQA